MFENHSKYPGVLFYENFKDNAEKLDITTGTKTFTLDKCFNSYGFITDDIFFIYTEIENMLYKIKYNELLIIFPEGILVAYFNIYKLLPEKLFLCYDSFIYNNNIISKILYNDFNTTIINENNKYYYVEVKKNIIYYNLKTQVQINIKNLNISENKINFELILNNNNILFNILTNNKINIKHAILAF